MSSPIVEVCVIEPTLPFFVETAFRLVGASMVVLEEVFISDFVCLVFIHKPASII
jgi:hypothetical protein